MNPIIRRELVGLLRTPQALLLQMLFVGVLSLLVVSRWPISGSVDRAAGQSQQVVRFFGYGMFLGVCMLAPVFPATSIVRERRKGTLLLLINSPLSATSIFFGKLVGSLGFVMLLLVLSTPVAAACYSMGGVNMMGQIVPLYGFLAVLALQFATLGLLVSTFAATPESAVRVTYMALAGLTIAPLGIPPLIKWLVAGTGAWVRCASPLPALLDLLGNVDLATTAAGDATGFDHAIRGQTIYVSLAISAFLALACISRLNTRLFDRARAAGKITDDRGLGVRTYRRIMYLWFFDPQRRTGGIGPLTNPVMIKEFRTRRFGRSNWIIRLGVLALIASLALMLAVNNKVISSDHVSAAAVVIFLQLGLIVIITPTLACGLISGERESGGWPLLQMTPMSASKIISGKLLSVGVPLLLILMSTLPSYYMLYKIQAIDTEGVPGVILSLLLTTVFAVLASAAFSSLFKRTSDATIATFATLTVLWGGSLLAWAAEDAPLSRSFVQKVLAINPLAASLSLARTPGFSSYNLTPANWWIMGAGCVVCLIVLVARTARLTRPD
ncbi:MAG: ABC transporter permease [Planctomycetota bacterium]|nr:ABC transporter permease [Planctomycetota bacterium]